MDEKKVQQAFVQFLAQKYKLKSQQELESKIQELGEEGLKKEYAEFQKVMTQQQSRKAMFGAKLNYIKGLKGQCPQGYELKYYKEGGRVCTKCEQIKRQAVPENPIDAFKCGRKMKKKACGGAVEKDKCGSKMKKKACGGRMKKQQEGGEINTRKMNRREGEYLDNGLPADSRANGALVLPAAGTMGWNFPKKSLQGAMPAGSRMNPIMLPGITVTPNGAYPSKPTNRYSGRGFRPMINDEDVPL